MLGVSSGYSVWGTSRSRTVFPLPLRLGHSDPRLHLSVFGCRLHPRLSSQSLASLGAACGAKQPPTNTFCFEECSLAPFRLVGVARQERRTPVSILAQEKKTTTTLSCWFPLGSGAGLIVGRPLIGIVPIRTGEDAPVREVPWHSLRISFQKVCLRT